jgi:hypothetical protein
MRGAASARTAAVIRRLLMMFWGLESRERRVPPSDYRRLSAIADHSRQTALELAAAPPQSRRGEQRGRPSPGCAPRWRFWSPVRSAQGGGGGRRETGSRGGQRRASRGGAWRGRRHATGLAPAVAGAQAPQARTARARQCDCRESSPRASAASSRGAQASPAPPRRWPQRRAAFAARAPSTPCGCVDRRRVPAGAAHLPEAPPTSPRRLVPRVARPPLHRVAELQDQTPRTSPPPTKTTFVSSFARMRSVSARRRKLSAVSLTASSVATPALSVSRTPSPPAARPDEPRGPQSWSETASGSNPNAYQGSRGSRDVAAKLSQAFR